MKSKSNYKKPNEPLVVKKAADSVFLCQKLNKQVYTDFYEPKTISEILKAVSEFYDINHMLYGGYESAERNMLCFSPCEFKDSVQNSFPISALFIDSSKFSNSLTHRDFLGALIGLGIDRSKIGDILVENGNAITFVHNDIKDFLIYNLEAVGRVKVKVSIYSGGKELSKENGKIITVTVPQLRIDSVVGEAFKLSRSKSQEIIKAEKVYVNWTLVNNVSQLILEGDVVSARGFGRAKIINTCGVSKKGRIFIELEVF